MPPTRLDIIIDYIRSCIIFLFLILCVCVMFSIFYERLFWDPLFIVALFSVFAISSFRIYGIIDRNLPRKRMHFIDKNPGMLSTILCIFGFLVRLSFIDAYPVFQYSDALLYFRLSENIANSGEYFQLVGGDDILYAYRPPGLPLLLAGFVALFGSQMWIGPAFNILIYAISCFVAYRVAVRLAGPTSAVMAVLLLALLPANIAIGPLTLTEPAALLFLLVGFWAILGIEKWGLAAFAGFALGFAALIRPTFLLLGPILIGLTLLRFFTDRQHLKQSILAVVTFVLVLAPWTYRNYEVLGSFVPGTTMGGVAFYMANNPASHTGVNAMEKDLFALDLDEVERNRVGFKWGLRWIKENPLEFLELSAKRFTRFSGKTSVYLNINVKEKCGCDGMYYSVLSILDSIWWLLVWSLVFFSVMKNKTIYRRGHWSVAIFLMIGFLFIVHSVFIAEARYHVPVAGLIVVVAATAFSNTFTNLHSRAVPDTPMVSN